MLRKASLVLTCAFALKIMSSMYFCGLMTYERVGREMAKLDERGRTTEQAKALFDKVVMPALATPTIATGILVICMLIGISLYVLDEKSKTQLQKYGGGSRFLVWIIASSMFFPLMGLAHYVGGCLGLHVQLGPFNVNGMWVREKWISLDTSLLFIAALVWFLIVRAWVNKGAPSDAEADNSTDGA